MSFTHLQVRSGYSLMKSTITIHKLITRAKELNFHALALTDEHVLYGTIPFYKTCKENGIKPIIGMTVKVIDEDQEVENCILLAKTNTGYQHLVKLSTYIQMNRKTALVKEELQPFSEDLICILPIQQSKLKYKINSFSFEEMDEYVNLWKQMFKLDDFYIGIEDHGQEYESSSHKILKAFQETNNIPVVAVNDVCYLEEKDVTAFDCLQAMKAGKRWVPSQLESVIRNRHLRSSVEMEQLFASFWPTVIDRTNEIVAKCNVTFDFNKRMLPSYPVPDQLSAHDYLEKLCWTNLKYRYNDVTEQVTSRLAYELNVIKSMEFSDYFLIVWDFIKYAKENHILVGPGRGSAAGSLVAFVLGITDVDPIEHNLLFERFLNPERITMSDIDIDFSDHKRDEVIEYVRKKYGEEHVAQIITFGTFAARSLIRELIKTIGIDEQDANFILREIPLQTRQSLVAIIKGSEKLNQYIKQSKKLTALFSIAIKLEGIPRHISTHAAGVVISEKPLVEHIPLTVGSNVTNLTQFSMNDLEAVGLLKIDFLGLRNLTLLERIIQSIVDTENKRITLSTLPGNDPKTFQLLQEGKTNGVFQLESDGMKQVLTRLKPTEFNDIVAVNALYRPGPSEFIPSYIDRKHGKTSITYPHPDLKPILESTYGVLIYQEQIMQIAHQIAGFTLGQADILRRAVSKKKQNVMKEQKAAFIEGCLKNGYDNTIAEKLFTWIVRFSNYGFNKSHAVAYSKISYQLAYLKAHYPKNFYAELLSSVSGQQDKIHMYMKELRELHIPIAPPSINKSFGKYTVEKECIRIGLLAIKGIGNQVVKEIIRARKNGPFRNLFDFCLRVSFKIINRSVLEMLIMAGAFDETYSNRASLLASIDQAIDQGELFREFTDQGSLFQDQLELEANYVDMSDFSPIKKLSDEKELLGIYVSSHPLAQYRNKLRYQGYITLQNTKQLLGKNHLKSIVIIQSVKKIRTKRGDSMAFVSISDETDEMDGVIFPELYRKISRWLKEEVIVAITGKTELRNDRPQWIINDLALFNEEELITKEQPRLFIKLTVHNSENALITIKEIAQQFPGNTAIIVYHAEKKQTYRLAPEYSIHPGYESLTALRNYFGKENIVFEKK